MWHKIWFYHVFPSGAPQRTVDYLFGIQLVHLVYTQYYLGYKVEQHIASLHKKKTCLIMEIYILSFKSELLNFQYCLPDFFPSVFSFKKTGELSER